MTIIKICGLSTEKAVEAADAADYAGFIVGSPRSYRNISLQRFVELRDELDHAKPVLVTVNSNIRFLNQLANFDDVIIQLHGRSRQFAPIVDRVAIGMNKIEYLGGVEQCYRTCSFITVDSITSKGYGGTGRNWNWEKLTTSNDIQVLVAGGINIDNVTTALRTTGATGIDVSSSVETDREKDPEKIKQLIHKVRNLS